MGKTVEVIISNDGCSDKVDLLAKVVATLHQHIAECMHDWQVPLRQSIRLSGPRYFRKANLLHIAYLISLDRTVG